MKIGPLNGNRLHNLRTSKGPETQGEYHRTEDAVELSGSSPMPSNTSLVPVQSAAAASLGPLGLSVAEQLEQLPVEYLRKKRLRWPWSEPNKKISAVEATELFQKGNKRLRVDYGDGVKPLRGETALGVLHYQLLGQSGSELSGTAELITDYSSRDATTNELLSPYDAYLKLNGNQPIVVLEQGVPLVRLDSENSVPELRKTPENLSQHAKAKFALEALTEDFEKVTPELIRGANLDPKEESFALELLDEYEGEELVGRFDALEGAANYQQSRATLTSGGWWQNSPATLKQAHQVSLKHGADAETLAGLKSMVEAEGDTGTFLRSIVRDPRATLMKRYPDAQDTLRKLFVGQSTPDALSLAAKLPKVKNMEILESASRTYAPEHTIALFSDVPKGQESYALEVFERVYQVRGSATEATEESKQLLKAIESARREQREYYHKNNLLVPSINYYLQELLAPERAPAREFFLEQLQSRSGRQQNLQWILPEVPGLNLEQRIELYEELLPNRFTQERYQSITGLMTKGRTLEQAKTETETLFAAIKAARTDERDYRHRSNLLVPSVNFYFEELLTPERAPARQFFLEQLNARSGRQQDLSWILPEVPGLNLEQRIELYEELLPNKFTQASYQAIAGLIAQGRTLEQAKTETETLFAAVEAARTDERDYRHRSNLLVPSVNFYFEELLTPARAPAREFFLQELNTRSGRQQDLQWILPEVSGLNLEQRIALYEELQPNRFTQASYQAITGLMAKGRTLEQAKTEVDTLFAAVEAARTDERDYRHRSNLLVPSVNFYFEELLTPERAPAREFFLEQLHARSGRQQDLQWILPEVSGLNLEQRIALYEELLPSKFSHERYKTITGLMAQGRTLAQAKTEAQTLFDAIEASRSDQRDYRHRDRLLIPSVNFYLEELLTPERAPAREFFLEQLQSKTGRQLDLDWVLVDVPNLNVEQRLEIYQEQLPQKFSRERYETNIGLLRAGRTLSEAKAETETLFQAIESARTQESDYRHRDRMVVPSANLYLRELLTPEREPARELFLELLNAKESTQLVSWLLETSTDDQLQKHVELARKLEYSALRTQLGVMLQKDGESDIQIIKQTERLDKQLYELGWRLSNVVVDAYMKTSRMGRVLLMAGLDGGVEARHLASSVLTLEDRLQQMSQLGLDPEEVEQALQQINGRLPLPTQLDAIFEVLILRAEQLDAQDLDIEIGEDEVVIGDFPVARQE